MYIQYIYIICVLEIWHDIWYVKSDILSMNICLYICLLYIDVIIGQPLYRRLYSDSLKITTYSTCIFLPTITRPCTALHILKYNNSTSSHPESNTQSQHLFPKKITLEHPWRNSQPQKGASRCSRAPHRSAPTSAPARRVPPAPPDGPMGQGGRWVITPVISG